MNVAGTFGLSIFVYITRSMGSFFLHPLILVAVTVVVIQLISVEQPAPLSDSQILSRKL